MNIKLYGKEYLKEVWKHKFRLLFGGIITILLLVVTCIQLYGGSFSKQFLIGLCLCVVTGGFIIFPMPFPKYISIPVSLLYLLMIPGKMFVRIEFPVHDMSRILEGAELANLFIIFLLFAILLLLLQRVHLALGIGSIVIGVVSVINFYVYSFRGSSVSFNDLLATGTALSVMNNYRLFMTAELWYSILYFCAFAALGFWCKVPYKGIRYHIPVSVIAIGYMIFFSFFWEDQAYFEKYDLQGYYWNMAENQQLNGFLLSFGIGVKEGSMDKPSDYSDRKFAEIEQSVTSAEEETKKPNIIFIMNEAWSDLRVLGNIETSIPFMPFVDSLSENTTKGYVHVGILGGLTANSEFEALTGDSLSLLHPTAIPYQLQVNHSMPSLATVLKEQGYQTMAMHPSIAHAWNRDDVYAYMGFDSFVDVNKFETEYLYQRTFLSDECNFNEIIYQYEHKQEDKPLFLFDVTIQNHADYYGGIDLPVEVLKVGDVSVEDMGNFYDLQTYLNLIRLSDQAFEKLVTYFEQVEEETIICMFGDHQPNLGADFYRAIFGKEELDDTEIMMKYMTPYVVWANFDTEFEDYGNMSANYLSAVLADCAKVEKSVFYEYLLDLHEKYPVISRIGCLDADGNRYRIDELLKQEEVENYHILQYNQLMDRDWKPAIFSVSQ